MSDTEKTNILTRIDPRLFFLIGALVVLFVIGLIINLNSNSTDDTSKIGNSITTDNGDLKINWGRYPTSDIELTESLTITKGGTYHLTGSLNDGSITVDAKNTVVRLILDNVYIRSSEGPAISCLEADDLVIELAGNNYIEDSANYPSDDTDTGTIISKADLTFNDQGGSLTVRANYQDAIVGKDDLKFNGGMYEIYAIDDGIRGTDSVYIVDGSFDVDASADAIKTSNATDSDKGFILVENGILNLYAGDKGLNATNSILIQNGSYRIDSYDDAIHSNNYFGMVDGDMLISAGDDGIHADKELIIDGGTIDISKSYEGLEAQAITINDGSIKILAFDDGLNAGGGTNNSTTTNNGRPNNDTFKVDQQCIIAINGGDLYVNASGDGIDSNGYLYFNNGNVIVDGPTNNGNGALDAGAGITMQGGDVIAVGASGMAESLGTKSGIPNISVFFETTQAAGTEIDIKDSAGQTILSHKSEKTFNHLAAGTSRFILGESYTIFVNGEEYNQFTISEVMTVIGNSNTNQFEMPGRGPRL